MRDDYFNPVLSHTFQGCSERTVLVWKTQNIDEQFTNITQKQLSSADLNGKCPSLPTMTNTCESWEDVEWQEEESCPLQVFTRPGLTERPKSRYLKNGTSDHNFKIPKTLFNTNYPPKPGENHLRNHFRPLESVFFRHFAQKIFFTQIPPIEDLRCLGFWICSYSSN